MKISFWWVYLLPFLLWSCRKEDLPKTNAWTEVEPEVLLDAPIRMLPNQVAPLAPLVQVFTKGKTKLRVRIHGALPLELEPGDSSRLSHEFYLPGLYAGKNNQISFYLYEESSGRFAQQQITYQTPPLPIEIPHIRIEKADTGQLEPGFTFCELNVGGQSNFRSLPFAFDYLGEVRWYAHLSHTGGNVAPFEPLRNGNFIYANAQGVFECDRGGREVNTWKLPGFSQHHDAIEKPDGHLILPVTRNSLHTQMDQIVELNRETGAITRTWDLREILDNDRFDLLFNRVDWLHVNSVWLDESSQHLIISARHQGVFKVSPSNELQWILAPHQGWGKAGVNGEGPNTFDFLLTAIDSEGRPYPPSVQLGLEENPDFRWPWGQHAALVLPNGNILLYDNGWNRGFRYDSVDFNRIVEYQIDEQKRTVRQVWQYGEQRGADLYSYNVCDVDVLPKTGNRLLISGNIDHKNPRMAKVVELTYPNSQIVFEATLEFKNIHARENSWDIIYRGERIDWNRH